MKRLKVQNPIIFLVITSLVAGLTIYLGTGPAFSIQDLLRTKTQPVTKTIAIPKITPKRGLPPTAINIPKIGKNLPIKIAHVTDNTWDLFTDALSWLSTSA